jgi:hypothetical protein
VEALEDRTLLSITAAQVTAIDNGLSALSSLGTKLNSFQQIAQPLAILNNTVLSQVLDIGQTLSKDLSTAASNYLASHANAAATDLATALSSFTQGNMVTVTGSADTSGNLTFHVALDVTQTANAVPLSLGPQAAALGIHGLGTASTATYLHRDCSRISSRATGRPSPR